MCTKDLLLRQEAREAAGVRGVTDTHTAPLKTPPHETAPSASNANTTHIVSQSQNTTHFNKRRPQEAHILQRDIPPSRETLTLMAVTCHFIQNHTLKAQSGTWNRNTWSNNFISTRRALHSPTQTSDEIIPSHSHIQSCSPWLSPSPGHMATSCGRRTHIYCIHRHTHRMTGTHAPPTRTSCLVS